MDAKFGDGWGQMTNHPDDGWSKRGANVGQMYEDSRRDETKNTEEPAVGVERADFGLTNDVWKWMNAADY